MQIGRDYSPYSDSDYNYNTHTHHFTKSLQEEQPLKKKGGITAENAGVTLELRGNEGAQKASELLTKTQLKMGGSRDKKGLGFLKGIWDAMGEKESQTQDVPALYDRKDKREGRGVMQSIYAAISAIRQVFQGQITGLTGTVREKIKVGIHTALKRFGRENEAFGALTDPGTGTFFGQRAGNKKGEHSAGTGTRKDEETLLRTPELSNEHLMDSYSKNGTYCKLNENLTYHKGRAPYKVSDSYGTDANDAYLHFQNDDE